MHCYFLNMAAAEKMSFYESDFIWQTKEMLIEFISIHGQLQVLTGNSLD